MSKLLEALRVSSKRLWQDFEESNLATHNGIKGGLRESGLKSLLRRFLPSCYGLGTGQAFSADGDMSKQLDLVVYDSVFSSIIPLDEAQHLFPSESVFGVVEVKSDLTTDELNKSIANVASLKRLSRAKANMGQILPHLSLNVGPGLSVGDAWANPYFGIVVAYDGLKVTNCLKRLDELFAAGNPPKGQLPDFVFCLKQGYMIASAKEGNSFARASDMASYAALETGDDTIPLLMLTLSALFSQVRLKSTNYNQHWIDLVNEILSRKKTPSK